MSEKVFTRITGVMCLDGYEDVYIRPPYTVGGAVCQLADYENTGKTPEELRKLLNGTAVNTIYNKLQRITYVSSIDGYEDIGIKQEYTLADAVCRLAEYENLGMTPMELLNVVR